MVCVCVPTAHVMPLFCLLTQETNETEFDEKTYKYYIENVSRYLRKIASKFVRCYNDATTYLSSVRVLGRACWKEDPRLLHV